MHGSGIPGWRSVPTRIGLAAHCDPSALALQDGEAHLNFGALCAAAADLTARLRRAGVGTETLVGICLPRSFGRIIAMLAVWQAGGAVLALDPALPPERLRVLLDDSQAPLVLATDALVPDLGRDGRTVLVVGEGTPLGSDHPAPPGSMAQPDTLAYVVYTSGSTGEPKGVEITHRNLAHLIDWHQAAFAVSPADRVSHMAGLGFDAAFWEVWPALCAGALVVLADEQVRSSATLLHDWLIGKRITVAFVPTVLADIMIIADWPSDTALRWMLTGGEALHRRPRPGQPFALVNAYGPSECTVVATAGLVPPDHTTTEPPDIGHAIAGARIHLLDRSGNSVMDGVEGEIFIGGAGVGRGYRNRPDLTQSRFLPDRFHPMPGAQLYRTGDVGRRLPDGRIAFLGRDDTQEQIRGVRVEPAEVAAVLSRHALVGWCTVIGDGSARDRRLVAYILPTLEAVPSGEDLRAFLARLLPEAMIPSLFARVERVPLSANGKLDRNALVAIATLLPGVGFVAPTTPAQARLSAIISELLGGVPVGADDNFFLLGGHSLLGTQVVLRAQETFGVQLSLRDLFRAPTVAALAERVADLLAAKLLAMTDEEAELWAAD